MIWTYLKAKLLTKLESSSGPLLQLMDAHTFCCKPAAGNALKAADPNSSRFNRALEYAYELSEKRECSESGYRRRLILYMYVELMRKN